MAAAPVDVDGLGAVFGVAEDFFFFVDGAGVRLGVTTTGEPSALFTVMGSARAAAWTLALGLLRVVRELM